MRSQSIVYSDPIITTSPILLYARVADETDYNPPLKENGDHDYGNVSVSSWTRFYAPKSKYASITAQERWENDSYASASASETDNPDNWDFN